MLTKMQLEFDTILRTTTPFPFSFYIKFDELLRELEPNTKTKKKMAPKRKPSSPISIGESSNPKNPRIHGFRFGCSSSNRDFHLLISQVTARLRSKPAVSPATPVRTAS